MKKRIIGAILLIAASVAIFASAAIPAYAVGERGGESFEEIGGEEISTRQAEDIAVDDSTLVKKYYSLLSITNKRSSAYKSIPVSLNSKKLGSVGKLIGGEAYIPLRIFAESNSIAKVSYNSSSRTLTLSGGGHNISVSDGGYAVYANGRVIFSKSPSVILSDGRMYIPATSLSKIFSLSASVSEDGAIFRGTPAPILSGDKYYREDEIYWLSRIISAESRGEPLVGQIAVGNVIMNRVRSAYYPNTIWGVIFDKKYGVQFSPVLDGTVYAAPHSTSVLAAKICLDGFSISDSVLFFLAPKYASSSWVPTQRAYLFTIGGHNFYA